MFRYARENRHRLIIATLGQESRRHAFALPAIRLVANDVDDEVNRFREDAQTTRDRIKARLQFREQANEFLRLKFG
jgi:hypothetical protein